MSEDRYTYPTDGADPRERDEDFTDAEKAARLQRERVMTHPQEPERDQATSADSPGFDPADRDRIEPDEG